MVPCRFISVKYSDQIKMTPDTPETFLVTTDANKDVMRFIFMSENLRCVVELPWRGDVLEKIEKEIGERFTKRAEELGVPDLLDRVADETVGITEEEILPFLQEKDHPALKMDPILG